MKIHSFTDIKSIIRIEAIDIHTSCLKHKQFCLLSNREKKNGKSNPWQHKHLISVSN